MGTGIDRKNGIRDLCDARSVPKLDCADVCTTLVKPMCSELVLTE